jgi:hypothetical protein
MLDGTVGPPIIDMLVWVAGCSALIIGYAVFDVWRLKRKKKPDA